MDPQARLESRVMPVLQVARETVVPRAQLVLMVRHPRCVDHQVCLAPRETRVTVVTKDALVLPEKLGSRAQMARLANKDLLDPREVKESKEHREPVAHLVTLVHADPRATRASPESRARMVALVILVPLATRATWAPWASRGHLDQLACRVTLAPSVPKVAWVLLDQRVTTEIKAALASPARKEPQETVVPREHQATKVAMVPPDPRASVAAAVTPVCVAHLVSWAPVAHWA